MFDFGFGEMVLAGVVALIVLGPERLPSVARSVGRWTGKVRAFAAGVKQELGSSSGLDELRHVKADFEQAAQEIRSGWQQTAAAAADALPPWERLPEPKTPADFGLHEDGGTRPRDHWPCGHTVSLQRQARARRRDVRRYVRVRPKRRPSRKY